MHPISSSPNGRLCEVCGGLTTARFFRGQLARATGMRYQEGRTLRRRVDPSYLRFYAARLAAAGIGPDWAGRRVCVPCYDRLLAVIRGA